MAKLNVYTVKGTKKKTGINMPKEYVEKENLKLLAQAVRVYESRVHAQNARTKRRGEVSASTRKIYAQKGTGRARHGALSAPLFVGGGKAHGPDGRSKTLKLPNKMAKKAFSVALSIKSKNGRLLVIEGIDSLKKTKDAAILISKLLKSAKISKATNITVAISSKNSKTSICFRNIKNVTVELFSNLNAYKAFNAAILIVDKDALSEIKDVGEKGKVSKLKAKKK